MIFWAVAEPTPGSASSSAWLAVFRATFFFAASAGAAASSTMAAQAAAIPSSLWSCFIVLPPGR
jgi:hypothetical protein